MPSIPGGQLPKETLTQWSGLNLRQDPRDVGEHELLRSVNADLHTELGALRVRQGRTLLSAVVLPGPVYAMFRHLGRRYQAVAGVNTLYRNFVAMLPGLGGVTRPTVLPYQPLNDETTWSFIADRALMRKDNGVTVSNWGIVAPTPTPAMAAGGAGVLTGIYGAVYTYARIVDGKIAHESNASPAPVGVNLTAQTLLVPLVASTDPQVTHIRVYRTVAGGSAYFFDQQALNATATATLSLPDGALGTAVETGNDPPPLASSAVEFQGHIFLCNCVDNPDYLYYSKRFRPESFPPDQFLKIGNPADPLLSMVALTGVIGVFTPITKYRVFGNSVTGFTALEALNSRGIGTRDATVATAKGVAFVARDGIWLTNFVEADVELSKDIQPLFYGQVVNGHYPIDFETAGRPVTLAEYKRRLYMGYQDTLGQRGVAIYSIDTQHWYLYVHDIHSLLYEEDTDLLLTGGTNGEVSIVEREVTDYGAPITLEAQFPPRDGGDRFARKGYAWLGVDSRSVTPWVLTFSVDGQTVTTASVQGARTKRYRRLPEGTVGRQWQVSALYTGIGPAALYAIEVLREDHAPGQVWVEDPENPDWFLQVLPGQPVPLPLQRRRFTFVALSADAGASGATWAVDVYIDGALAGSVTMPAQGVHRLCTLPEGLTGYDHYSRVRYSGADVPLLQSVDVLEAPHTQGQVWVEEPTAPTRLLQFLPGSALASPVQEQRMTFLSLDAHAAQPGTWTVDLLVDGTRRATVEMPHTALNRLHALPPGLRGYEWRANVRYSGTATPFVQAVTVLDTGAGDGQVWIEASGDPGGGSYQTILPATEAINPFLLKRFLYIKTDIESSNGFWTIDFYIDNILRQKIDVRGLRSHPLIRLAPGLLGHTWRIVAHYSLTAMPSFYGVQVIAQELAPA